jgi:hypothetical protein
MKCVRIKQTANVRDSGTHIYVCMCSRSFHSRFIPEEVAEASTSEIYLRDVHVLPRNIADVTGGTPIAV